MQTIRRHSENHIARFDLAAINNFRAIDHADDATDQIVLAFAIHVRQLRRLAPDQCALGRTACAGKSVQQLIEHVRFEFFAADVVKEEERAGADDRNVVDAVVHQIRADGVVLV